MQTPNCYKCKYRRDVPGDAHSRCVYPGVKSEMTDFIINGANNIGMIEMLNLRADPHGVKSGWFMWPCNFDPVWLRNCDGFSEK